MKTSIIVALFTCLLALSSCAQSASQERYEMESKGNADVLKQLRKQGDKLLVARDVNHYAYFPTAKSRDSFAKDAKALGYEVESSAKVDGPLPYEIVISKEEKVDQKSIDKITFALLDLALKYGGDYDGWECLLVTD